jgi:hypothetical protein
MPLEYGVDTMLSLPMFLSSTKSLLGRSYEISASPRSSSARRLPAEGTMRHTMRRTFGSGPPVHLSLRSRMTSVPAFQLTTR